jgi:hypothetical protein
MNCSTNFFFSNWNSIEACYTVLQYESSILHTLMSFGPIQKFALQFKGIEGQALHQISPFTSNIEMPWYCITTSKAQRPLDHPYTLWQLWGDYGLTTDRVINIHHFHVSIIVEMADIDEDRSRRHYYRMRDMWHSNSARLYIIMQDAQWLTWSFSIVSFPWPRFWTSLKFYWEEKRQRY